MKKLHIVHLYPRDMNIYGDTGNRLVLEKRLAWRDIAYETTYINPGDKLPSSAHLIIGGGGQDAGQQKVEADLLKKGPQLHAMTQDGVVMLMICGLYQLFGDAFITAQNETIRGISLLPLFTQAGDERLIGNVVLESEWGELVGYENHSGRTWLHKEANPFGRVIKGKGNNGEDRTEGVRHHNVFGSYLHGPLLSKNPLFADHLLQTALQHVNYFEQLSPLDDSLERKAAQVAKSRPR